MASITDRRHIPWILLCNNLYIWVHAHGGFPHFHLLHWSLQYQQCTNFLNLLWWRGISFHPAPARRSFPGCSRYCFGALQYALPIGHFGSSITISYDNILLFLTVSTVSTSAPFFYFHINSHSFLSVNQLEHMQRDHWGCVIFEFNTRRFDFFGDSPMEAFAFNRTSIFVAPSCLILQSLNWLVAFWTWTLPSISAVLGWIQPNSCLMLHLILSHQNIHFFILLSLETGTSWCHVRLHLILACQWNQNYQLCRIDVSEQPSAEW